ncbi:hypothetical protein OK016_16450 [Vibrio chagasii]|nr:hypothetical protein [Vibrio chagasii]
MKPHQRRSQRKYRTRRLPGNVAKVSAMAGFYQTLASLGCLNIVVIEYAFRTKPEYTFQSASKPYCIHIIFQYDAKPNITSRPTETV